MPDDGGQMAEPSDVITPQHGRLEKGNRRIPNASAITENGIGEAAIPAENWLILGGCLLGMLMVAWLAAKYRRYK